MQNFQDEVINRIAIDLKKKKDQLLLNRITEKTNESIGLNEESMRMFPRLKCVFESTDQSEHWYWNDGTINGQHLISFYPDDSFDFNADNIKFNAGFKYR